MEDELAKKEKKTEEFKEELRKAMEDIGGRKIDQDLLQLENETKAQSTQSLIIYIYMKIIIYIYIYME